MSIAQPTHTQPLPPSPSPAPTPRGTTPSSHRPRPVSMPPQLALPTGPASVSSSVGAKGDRPQVVAGDENAQRRRQRDERDQATSRPSRTNRILGDYTLSKTLGAGSMGKVKLATHNVTGEKVRRRYWKAKYYSEFLYSSPSKSFHAFTPHPKSLTEPTTQTLRQHDRPRRMPQKRSEPSGKRHFLCSSTTRISVACER